MSNFDIDKLTEFAIQEIKKFSSAHQSETFYGFSIDASLLCLNSIEEFEKSLAHYRKRWGGYQAEEEIKDLKENTGDWEYQGFAQFKSYNGFDMNAYNDHYHMDDDEQLDTDYAKAMDAVVENLKRSDAFDNLKKTDDFYVNRVEHN